jgi:DNA polymerase-3 subunit gamma/tau
MGQALYRTYRSKKLSEVVGQEPITTALDHALKQGTISHAYLFTGPRGVGKTSIARILAYEINGLAYGEDRPHLDIIEIDAASNRRIDEIRDLRDKVHIAPTSAKYKVYIIDEVHMLTKEAFNALLKTLEEPPAHVVFILATTEAHKLPETIISRTQRYTFKPIEQDKVVAHLKHIAKSEKIDIADDALALVAAHGEGSFRDSISLLDQARNTKGKVSLADVQTLLGIAPAELLESIVRALHEHDSVAVARALAQIRDQGYEATQVAKQLSASLRSAVIERKNSLPHETAMKLLSSLVQVPASPDPYVALELCLLDAALTDGDSPKSHKIMSEEVAPTPSIEVTPKHEVKKHRFATDEGWQPLGQLPPQDRSSELGEGAKGLTGPPPEDGSGALLSAESWEIILNALKQKHNTLYSIVKTAQAHFEPGTLTLEFGYAFHQKRLRDAGNKQALLNIVQDVTGSGIQIKSVLGSKPNATSQPPPLPAYTGEIVHSATSAATPPAPNPQTPETAAGDSSPGSSKSEPKPQNDSIKTISNIFGGAELLES